MKKNCKESLHHYDCLIAGGGPGGAIAAITLARAGVRCAVFEKQSHPRFHLGESILPASAPFLKEMGLWDEIKKLPHLPKFGAAFGFADNHHYQPMLFDQGILPADEIFNLERSGFDQVLLDTARQQGAAVFENTPVKKIITLEKNKVILDTAAGTFTGKMLLDASGNAAIVGRHFNRRKVSDNPHLRKVAYFAHFTGVEMPPGKEAGSPLLFMCQQGWFWMIGLDQKRTSVGFVANPDLIKRVDVAPENLLQWAIARAPAVRGRMKNASGWAKNKVLADFSYSCAPFAGEGYFLIGDAACFLDPIFSTGTTLAMLGGREAALKTIDILRGKMTFEKARKKYQKFIERCTGSFKKLIVSYYDHCFREFLMCARSPLKLRGAVISVLAGYIFPKMCWKLRWRMEVLFFLAKLQRYVPIVPRWKKFSLFDENARQP